MKRGQIVLAIILLLATVFLATQVSRLADFARILSAGPGVEVLATLPDGSHAAVRQGRLLATTFHPELTSDRRVHRYFLKLIENGG